MLYVTKKWDKEGFPSQWLTVVFWIPYLQSGTQKW
ncbi:hypothetical protein SLEP1_g33334 [Rubroshorea leprosula]|uniref:Uncharacterized protein n=1 Tax=Rubroshorea leprosula TaxID=152421 RepID=A0AAV5KG91_9ROSI|nr:hypothetical protein SLEP1_g33334 [Rubroshorea leprosula]